MLTRALVGQGRGTWLQGQGRGGGEASVRVRALALLLVQFSLRALPSETGTERIRVTPVEDPDYTGGPSFLFLLVSRDVGFHAYLGALEQERCGMRLEISPGAETCLFR